MLPVTSVVPVEPGLGFSSGAAVPFELEVIDVSAVVAVSVEVVAQAPRTTQRIESAMRSLGCFMVFPFSFALSLVFKFRTRSSVEHGN
jgi:hypothetical protein